MSLWIKMMQPQLVRLKVLFLQVLYFTSFKNVMNTERQITLSFALKNSD